MQQDSDTTDMHLPPQRNPSYHISLSLYLIWPSGFLMTTVFLFFPSHLQLPLAPLLQPSIIHAVPVPMIQCARKGGLLQPHYLVLREVQQLV